ncbi:hypothetical protein ElyMa_005090600, partial [Elysia marginata]
RAALIHTGTNAHLDAALTAVTRTRSSATQKLESVISDVMMGSVGPIVTPFALLEPTAQRVPTSAATIVLGMGKTSAATQALVSVMAAVSRVTREPSASHVREIKRVF